MPEDLPKAVLILLWLLVGVIIFGYLLMEHSVLMTFVFAAVYYGLPTFIYWRFVKGNTARTEQ